MDSHALEPQWSPPGNLLHAELDTRHIPCDMRLQMLDEHLNGGALPSEHRVVTSRVSADNPNVNIGELLVGECCNLLVMKSSGYEITCVEPPRLDTRADFINVAMIREGYVEIDNKMCSERLGPGDIYVNATNSYRHTILESEIVRLMFPSGLLARSSRRGEYFAVRKSEPVSQILKAAISSLETTRREGGPNSRLASRLALDLASKVFEEHINRSAISGYDVVRARALEYIHDHIANPELNIDEIAAYAAASRSTLYRAFESLGGIRGYITFVRVEMARTKMGVGKLSRGDVSNIAYSCGFSSPEQFSKAFKARLGVSPASRV